jgi:uncharacterized protein with HEPN domain
MGRLSDYLQHMTLAAQDACEFVDGLSKADFCNDKRTQLAVIMELIIIGEVATKVMDQHEAFARSNPAIPWRNMRGMRNRIAHGYFDMDLDVVWDTVKLALPDLLTALAKIRP